ncbi:MAG: ATPase [Saprospiraceae bacterium]|nr:ATPase [Saprospiraceae bacterium]
MFLIVESGSTKADWVAILPSGETHFFKTTGINPATQSIYYDLNKDEGLLKYLQEAEFIFFYGAGVINEVTKERIKHWLQSYGTQSKIGVESDLLAAVRACSGHNAGVVGILGTGSNSCFFNGKDIVETIPSLGYILGDEGSGAHIGKEILRRYFCKKMPLEVQNSFLNHFKLTREDLIEQVYKQNAGSSYIASFASFLTIAEESWKSELLLKVFKEFIEYRICTLKEHTSYPIHFAGSIAYYHQKYLAQALNEFGLHLGEVVHQPIHELIDYHFKQIYNE